MQIKLKWIAPLLALFALAAPALPARAASGIDDNAHFFSQTAIHTASDVISQVQSQDHHDVYVVTFEGIPESRTSDYESQGKTAFFENWANQIGRDAHVEGIVILITRTPGHLQIDVGNRTRQRAFTMSDRQTLTNQMLSAMRDKRFDDALTGGVQFIKGQMDAHLAGAGSSSGAAQNYPSAPMPMMPPGASSSGSWGGMVCLGVGILLVVFLIIRAMGGRSSGPGPGYNAGQYPPNYGAGPGYGGGYGGYGGGGGGFGRGLLGGLLGGALGAWGYDQFEHRGNSAGAAPPPQGGGDFGASPDPGDTSYSGGGGDFDSSNSSGGDFGSSSDNSGGGFGGGDSGGGGDFGGGGGDSGSSSGGGDF